jgi:hypothetical protein
VYEGEADRVQGGREGGEVGDGEKAVCEAA